MQCAVDDFQIVCDFGCGTATSAALYYLAVYNNYYVIAVDRDHTAEWVRSHLPLETHERFIFVQDDMLNMSSSRLEAIISERWPDRTLSSVRRVHWSPSCTTLSRATRGLSGYRDSFGRPTHPTSVQDDIVFEHGVTLVQQICDLSPKCCATIENPYSEVFPMLPGVRRLLTDRKWRLLLSSHCSNTGEMDTGFWPQKDTYVLACRVPRNFHLRLCDFDCQHLMPGTARHKAVLCSNHDNHVDQVVISDTMTKGMIPMGVFHQIDKAHSVWCARHVPVRCNVGMLAPLDESTSEDDLPSEEASDEEAEWAIDFDRQIGQDGPPEIEERVQPLRAEIPLPFIDMSQSAVQPHALQYPALQHGESRWDVELLQPWQLIFADEISFDFVVKGKRQHMLIVGDLKTNGIRVRPTRFKTEHATEFDKLVTMESLDKRPYKVTVCTDGCGSMSVLLAAAAFQRQIDHLPIPPDSPHLNLVEGMIASFKADVSACLLAACLDDGPINESFVALAADYVAYTRERFPVESSHSTGKTRFELNTGVPPRPGCVPFGCPGWAYIPKQHRKKRGGGKHMRTEPILCIGYQHMYTRVYKCLTRRGTVIHTEQVSWDMDSPLGRFLATTAETPSQSSAAAETSSEPSVERLRTDLFKAPDASPTSGKNSPHTTVRGLPEGIIRLNNDKVFKADGSPKPVPYIFHRIQSVDGLTTSAACALQFPDKNGKLRRYSRDCGYDLYTSGWIKVVPLEAASEEATESTISAQTAFTPAHKRATRYATHLMRKHQWQARACHPPRRWRGCVRLHRRLLCRLQRQLCKLPDVDITVSVEDILASPHRRIPAYLAMRDLPWKPYLSGKDAEVIRQSYAKELQSLCDTVLRELGPDDPELPDAKQSATPCRALLEFKRQGVWKSRVVIQGFRENKLALDGPDFQYASDVIGLTAIRTLFLTPMRPGEAIAQMDISTAFLQSDLFPDDAPPRYLKLQCPVKGTVRYFRQYGVVYGSASSPKRWQDTLHTWLSTPESDGGGGYVQGKNDPCVFYHPRLKVRLGTYVDDLAGRGQRANVEEAFDMIRARFKCKEPAWLDVGASMDHLGMLFCRTEQGVFLSMENYIDAMLTRLDVEVSARQVKVPMSSQISDFTPLSAKDSSYLQSAVGMIGWLAGTGRPDLKFVHSRIAAYMSAPCAGALQAVNHAIQYCAQTKSLCLFQPSGHEDSWHHFSDSDHAGNAEPNNKRKSQLGYVSFMGRTPVGWGSKTTSVQFDSPVFNLANGSLPSKNADINTPDTLVPSCHSQCGELHPDMSSGAAEIYAASIALTEILHLSYIVEEMGMAMPAPHCIGVDNTTAIAFSKGNVRRSKLKHIDARQQWVEHLRDKQLCDLTYVNTTENIADFFTKLLPSDRFIALRDQLLVNMPISALI